MVDINKILELWQSGKTYKEIATDLGVSRKKISNICKEHGFQRSKSETGRIVHKSKLDNPDMISRIRDLRKQFSASKIAEMLGTSQSSVLRICNKHDIREPSNYSELQSARVRESWTDEKRAAISDKTKKLMQDRRIIEKISNSSRKSWSRKEYRELQAAQKESWDTERRLEYSRKMKQVIEDNPDIRSKLSESSKRVWADRDYREVQARERSKMRRVSSIQGILYSILDDLGVKYYRERESGRNDPATVIGPYNFDCVIPRPNGPDLIIECNGDYWHSLPRSRSVDSSKSSYIDKYYGGTYELRVIWEHEFQCKDRVCELIKYWLGIHAMEAVDFEFGDVVISDTKASDYRLLLSKYHYLHNAGRGGMAYGAYLGEELIAVCIFSPMVRQNLPWDNGSSRELSRFCIHPRYQKKNFASWFLSRCIKRLPDQYDTVISYCDTTFNHDGTIYRAANFVLDGEVRPDYWYVAEDGWVMHKKTLYSKAVQMRLTEKQYAEEFGYRKVFGSRKLRFIYKRD